MPISLSLFFRLLFCIVAIRLSSIQIHADPKEEQPEKPVKVETRIYNIGEFIQEIKDYTFTSVDDLTTAPKSNDRPERRPAGMFMSSGSINRQERQDMLMKILQELIDPPSWREAGGSLGAVRVLDDLMIVTQTVENLLLVEKFFDDIQRQFHIGSMIQVDAKWIQLSADQLLDFDKNPQKRPDILADKSELYSTVRVTFFNGQTVCISSGIVNPVIKNIAPSSSEGGQSLYLPEISSEQSGVILQIGALVSHSRQSLLVDVHSIVGKRDFTFIGTQPTKHASSKPSTRPTSQPTRTDMTETAKTARDMLLNRPAHLENVLRTAVRLEPEVPFLVGGMTLEPGKPDSKPLYLVLTARIISAPEKKVK